MRKFGYLESRPSTSESLLREDAVIAAIKNVQKFGAINETGMLDNATLKVCWIMLTQNYKLKIINFGILSFCRIYSSWRHLDVVWQISNGTYERNVSQLDHMDGRNAASHICTYSQMQ